MHFCSYLLVIFGAISILNSAFDFQCWEGFLAMVRLFTVRAILNRTDYVYPLEQAFLSM